MLRNPQHCLRHRARSRRGSRGRLVCEDTADVLNVSKLLIPTTHAGNSLHYRDASELSDLSRPAGSPIVLRCGSARLHLLAEVRKRYCLSWTQTRTETEENTPSEVFHESSQVAFAELAGKTGSLRTAQPAVAVFIFKSCVNTQLSGGSQEAPVSDGGT